MVRDSMPDLLIAPELRDAVRDLILRGRYPDDPAGNVLGAVVQLNGLAAVAPAEQGVAAPQAEKPRRQRGRPRRGPAAVPPEAPAADAEGAS
jgi:hypothetical protein